MHNALDGTLLLEHSPPSITIELYAYAFFCDKGQQRWVFEIFWNTTFTIFSLWLLELCKVFKRTLPPPLEVWKHWDSLKGFNSGFRVCLSWLCVCVFMRGPTSALGMPPKQSEPTQRGEGKMQHYCHGMCGGSWRMRGKRREAGALSSLTRRRNNTFRKDLIDQVVKSGDLGEWEKEMRLRKQSRREGGALSGLTEKNLGTLPNGSIC